MIAFFKSKLNIALSVVLALVVAFGSIQAYKSWNSIARWLGIETEEVLREKLKDANKNVDKAVDANKSLEAGLIIRDEGAKIETSVREERDREMVKVAKKTETIKRDVEKKVEEINNQVDLSEQEKTSQISKVRIESLWKAFCSFQTHENCQAIEGEQK